jgi:nucleotide-binding universal stress UspA family protein
MSYRTIVVQIDTSSGCKERTRIAVELAARYQSHLTGAAATGISRYIFPGGWTGDGMGYTEFLAAQMDVLRQNAKTAAAAFEDAVRLQQLSSTEALVIDDEAGAALSLRGRYSDLVVLGQTNPEQLAIATPPDLPQYVTMHCGQPVLLIPVASSVASSGRRPLVAWDGSIHAMRAVRGALPFLKSAEQVEVAVFGGEKSDLHGDQPGDDIALFLSRHGVRVDVIRSASPIGDGEPLLSLAQDKGADMLVMGCYGHTRMRELVMGGVTRTVLRKASVPVLMAH